MLNSRVMHTPQILDDASRRSFHLDQLKLVRAEADKLADETRVTERYVLSGCGAIYTFFFVQWNHLRSLPFPWLLLLPLLLVLWGLYRCDALYTRISSVRNS